MKLKILMQLMLIAVLVFLLPGCSREKQDTEKNTFNFDTKEAQELHDDGWLYYCYVDYDGDSIANAKDVLNYYYGACNIYFKSVEGYDRIPVIDRKSGQITDYAESEMSFLLLGEKERGELEALNAFLNEKKFCRALKTDDLEGLSFEYIDREQFIRLFNEMMDSPELADGSFSSWPESGMLQNVVSDGYQWQVGYYVSHGNLIGLHMTPVIIQGEEQMNLREMQEMDDSARKVCEFLASAEKKILTEQSFSGIDFEQTIGRYDLSELERLLKQMPVIE